MCKWPSREPERKRIITALVTHSTTIQPLPGIQNPQALETLATQFIASLRREDYYRFIQRRPISAERANPNDPRFNAERAVAYHVQQENIDEAAWLVFLMTHFGRPADTGWLRLKNIYSRLHTGIWDWATVSANPALFANWLAQNWQNIPGRFGSHRKYESLRPNSRRPTASVVTSYINWVGANGHSQHFANTIQIAGNNPHTIFDTIYQNMHVTGFGRLAKFDYLALIGRYNIAPINAGSAYLNGATGPARGAHLLFDGQCNGHTPTVNLQNFLTRLDFDLNVGMQAMEDALCNWQKSPLQFIHFVG